MTRIVHLDGHLLPEEKARISPFDRGFLLADAVFETMRAYGGRCHALERHLARLRRSCEVTRIPFPDDLPRRIDETLRANDLEEAGVRVTLTRGPGGRGASPTGAGPSTVLVTATPIPHPPEIYERGLRLASASRPRIDAAALDPAMKTTNYLVNVLARMEAEDAGADDALFFDAHGHLVEATQANVFARFGKTLATPPLSSGCLPGLTREDVLALAPEAGLRPEERPLTREDLLRADELMLTGSMMEVVPAVALDGEPIGGGDSSGGSGGSGRPGPMARRLHELYRSHAQHHG